MAIGGILSLAVMAAPVTGKMLEFPKEWGEPPEQQVKDLVPLTGGYGHGSSSIDSWIQKKMREDRAARKRNYPADWGAPPMIQTRDMRTLPFGYGQGSSTLNGWIAKNAKEVSGTTVEEYQKNNPNPYQEVKVPNPIGRPGRSYLKAAPIG